MIARELVEFIRKNGPVTYEQISKSFHFGGLTYHHLANLVKEGQILKLQSGDIFLYKVKDEDAERSNQ